MSAKNTVSFKIFKGLDPSIFTRAAEYVDATKMCCCCPAIEHVVRGALGAKNLDMYGYAFECLVDEKTEPYLDALAYVFKPFLVYPSDPWWDNLRHSFETKPRVIALLLCAEFCREANGE